MIKSVLNFNHIKQFHLIIQIIKQESKPSHHHQAKHKPAQPVDNLPSNPAVSDQQEVKYWHKLVNFQPVMLNQSYKLNTQSTMEDKHSHSQNKLQLSHQTQVEVVRNSFHNNSSKLIQINQHSSTNNHIYHQMPEDSDIKLITFKLFLHML